MAQQGVFEANDDTVTMPPIAATHNAHEAPAVTHKTAHKQNLALIVTLSVLAALILASIVALGITSFYFSNRVAPGVTFGSTSVVGMTEDELTKTVTSQIKSSTVVLNDGDKQVKASLTDLGVKPDVKATVANILDAKPNQTWWEKVLRVNPFQKVEVPLKASTDEYALSSFVTSSFVGQEDQAVPSSVNFDSGSAQFVVSEGKVGKAAQPDKVDKAVASLIRTPGSSKKADVTYAQAQMPISVETAQSAADQANGVLGKTIAVSNGNNVNIDIPRDVVASWITLSPDMSKGTISISYNNDAVNQYVTNDLVNQLNQQKVDQHDMIDANGTVVFTSVHGVDGVTVNDVAGLSSQVTQALTSGQGGNITAQTTVEPFATTQEKVTTRIVVDRTTQTATVYKDGQAVRTFNVCTGLTGRHETTPGTYPIYLRYDVQDMTGLNDDGSRYLSKGVKWVSYFNGGEGFHTASWNNYGIAHGDPATAGSHGCVNMYEQDAKWIYDNCPKGTLVQIVGTTPSSAVR